MYFMKSSMSSVVNLSNVNFSDTTVIVAKIPIFVAFLRVFVLCQATGQISVTNLGTILILVV